MNYMIYSSKYNAILKMLLLLPGRVAMEECSRLFVLNLGHTICFSGKRVVLLSNSLSLNIIYKNLKIKCFHFL